MTEIDANTLERARDGDRQAHAALYRAFAPMVFTLACRMLGSRSLAEDVLQDSFVDVIRKADQFRGDAAIGAWIKRIAINHCLSHLRSPWVRRRIATDHDAWPDSADHVSDPDRTVARDAELERALAGLSGTARAVVWLHAVEGYTHGEIAEMTGRSTSFSKSQLARAYRQLRADLEPGPDGRDQVAGPDEADNTDEGTQPCLGVLKTV